MNLWSLFNNLQKILFFPVWLIQRVRSLFIWAAAQRFYLFAFIPCSAGLWPLGLYCWNRPVARWYLRLPLRIFAYLCVLAGSFLFIAGLWRFTLILLLIRLLLWIDGYFQLGRPILREEGTEPTALFAHPLDKISLFFIGVIFVIFAINKERLLDFTEPSDHFYHMAAAQKILERGEIPLWDDWEFAPMGRPHLYPPFLHLLIAFFAGSPDNVLAGFATVQMLLYPLALLCYWMLFRMIMPPALAYLALIFASMEFMFAMGCLMGLPASIVNVLWALILIAVLKRHTYIATLLLGLAFYTHTGMPVMIALGLLVFGLWRREFLRSCLFIVMGAMLLSMPWMVRYIAFSDWMQTSGAEGFSLSSILTRLLWLQILNPVLLILAAWGWFRYKDRAITIVRSQVIGLLPMLTQYGGRFFMHGSPFLAPFIAVCFRRWIEGYITWRRALGFLSITLIPLPCISFMNSMKPSPFPGITATHISGFYMLHRQQKDYSEMEALVQAIKDTTSPDDIIHLPDDGHYHFGDFLVVMTGRRTDMGGWGEVRKPEMWEAVHQSREDASKGVFVSRKRENIPEGRVIEAVGTYFLGYPRK